VTFRRLLGFLRPYRGQVIASTLLAVFAQAAGLTIPYLTGQVIDTVSAASHSDRRLFTYAALVVAAGVVKGVLMLFRRWLAGRLSLSVEYDLRNAMYAHLQRLSFGFFVTHQAGQPIRLNHILMLNNIQFPKAGDYVFNVLVGDDQKAAIDLRLVEVRQPQTPAQPAPPPSES